MSTHNSFSVAKKDEKGRNIQVVVRCRPFNNAERKSAAHGVIDTVENRKEINVRTGGIGDKAARKTYTFDMVFGPSAKQIDVYKSVVCPILDEVIGGYNCTVFAYGQTGTGKTFTMEGERSPNEEFTWEEDPLAGIIPRTLHQIFEKLSESGTEFSVKVSLLEIYNEELFDLLSPFPDVTERLQLFDDPRNKRGVIIKGLEEITVHNKNEVYQILERGSAKRKTASTLMNAYSSRSHSVFSVTIHMKEITVDGEELVKIGKLNLVDLAGSENIGRSGAVDKRAREAGNINQSLLTLGRVITALVEKRPHVPYRESKLTRILQDSLGGRTKTSIIATVSPASINLEETLSTLDYANRAKNIMNKPEVNQKLTKRTLIKEYTEEIERLKRDLAATRDKNGVYLSSENYESMAAAISSQEDHITEYTEKIAAVEEELKSVTELFEDRKEKLDKCTNDLEEKNQKLQETHRDLQQTKQKLTEEEFIVSELATTEEKLYTTADKLLSTVDESTKDVSGLHAKLERKKKVEEHNSEIQMSFADCMDAMFSQMQKSVEDQHSKHQGMLDSYKTSVGEMLEMVQYFEFTIVLLLQWCLLCFDAIDPVPVQLNVDENPCHSHYQGCMVNKCAFLSDLVTSLLFLIVQGMTQVIQCLQNQLNLLAMETQNNYAGLMNASDALQVPIQSLQQTLQTVSENQTATQKERLESTTASLISEVQQTAQEAMRTVDESSCYCSHLHSSLTQLGEKSLQWCASTEDGIDSQAQAQLTLIRDQTRVEQSCEERVQEVSGQLKQQQEMVKEGLGSMKEQTSLDQNTLEHHQTELKAHLEDGLARVHSFLSDELLQDVPTGATPRRRDFVYPRLLAKSKSRAELLENLCHKQEELQTALFQCDALEEEKQVDQDSLEDEVSGYGYVTEPPYIDENLMCYESGRVPFFKQKKAGKKEKSVNRSKMVDNDTQATPVRSKLPLRCQN
uniref:Kinesin-like protein n=1 Tax=Oncorhynchus tshawytscha TaxID=74940 RepID=A0A8C8HDU9_ONCTS